MSSLRVNFYKCYLFGINIPTEELNLGASILDCDIESGQFVYLGMKIGINNHIREGVGRGLYKK